MDERAGAARLAGALADRLSPQLPAGLEMRAEGDALLVYAGGVRSMVIPVRPFGDGAEAAEAAMDVLLAARDEAEGHARGRYETAAATDGDVVRVWFGRVEQPGAEPPWHDVVAEMPALPIASLLLEDASASTPTVEAVVTLDSDPYPGVMDGVHSAQPVRSLTLTGRRTRGYKVDLYREESGLGLDRRGRRRVLRLGSLRLEWYPK
ncbi:MAG TPA: hypothetical protein VFI18_06960 [Gaiellales bacterium]|nr:hypothetical protein [Gaiellales bacterium]